MAINWRIFGSGGIETFADIPVHQQFFSAPGRHKFGNRFVKTLFGHPRWFGALCDHGPEKLDLVQAEAEFGVPWGTAPLVWVNPSGRVLPYWQPQAPLRRWVEPGGTDHGAAQINHYMLRSAETFGTKRGLKSPSAGKDRYNQAYWDRADTEDEIDTSALRHEPEFSALRKAALALPGVAALHYQCCADHIAQICERAGLRAEADPRYGAFLAQARQAVPGGC